MFVQGLWPFSRRVDPRRRTQASVMNFPCWMKIFAEGAGAGAVPVREPGVAPCGIAHVLGEHITSHALQYNKTARATHGETIHERIN